MAQAFYRQYEEEIEQEQSQVQYKRKKKTTPVLNENSTPKI